MDSLNIIEWMDKNPIARLTTSYQNKLLCKIKDTFTDNEQKLFVTSFYCYLNYHPRNDFVIDLDNIWKWLGFQQKYHAKNMLEKHFTKDIDYKSFAPATSGAKKGSGGHNKETIMLNIKTFKMMCLKAGTKKADEIHDYYIKLEETLQDVIQQESDELKCQLEATQLQIELSEKDKNNIREKTLLEQFPSNTQCVYYGMIDNLSYNKEPLIKFGNSNNLKNRVKQHKDTYQNFHLINAYRVDNKLQIESAMKSHPFFVDRQRCITIKNKKYIELLNIDNTCISEIDKIIKEIVISIEYSPDNYKKILEENILLKKKIEEKSETKIKNELILLIEENKRIKKDNLKMIQRLKKKGITIEYESDIEYEKTEKEFENYNKIVNTYNRYFIKNKDGTYLIDNKIFMKLEGTRVDVWNGKAYKTSGGLIKTDLLINRLGKIVSKKKCIQETINNRFEKLGVNKSKTMDPSNSTLLEPEI